jgi:hypothetical protein
LTISQYRWDPSNYPPKDLKFLENLFLVLQLKKVFGWPLRAFRGNLHWKVPGYRSGEKFCTVKLNSISVRESRHQSIKNYNQTIPVSGFWISRIYGRPHIRLKQYRYPVHPKIKYPESATLVHVNPNKNLGDARNTLDNPLPDLRVSEVLTFSESAV